MSATPHPWTRSGTSSTQRLSTSREMLTDLFGVETVFPKRVYVLLRACLRSPPTASSRSESNRADTGREERGQAARNSKVDHLVGLRTPGKPKFVAGKRARDWVSVVG